MQFLEFNQSGTEEGKYNWDSEEKKNQTETDMGITEMEGSDKAIRYIILGWPKVSKDVT